MAEEKMTNQEFEKAIIGEGDLKVSPETIARTVILALALINQILACFGKGTIPFAENNVYQIVSFGYTAVASVWGFWKNNSFTRRALMADIVKNALGGK